MLVVHLALLLAALADTASNLSPLAAAALASAMILSGFLAKLAYDGIKTIIPPYDKLPAIVHQVAAPVFGLLFGYISTATGAELLTDIHGINVGWIGAIFTALVQAGFKRLEKAHAPGDATIKVERSREGLA